MPFLFTTPYAALPSMAVEDCKMKPIAMVRDGPQRGQLICVHSDVTPPADMLPYAYKWTDTPEGSHFMLFPRVEPMQRNIYYIAGPSGCGKSTMTKQICQMYKMVFPKRKIYLFSEVPEDPALDNLPKKKGRPRRLDVNKLVEEPIEDLSLFEESMVVFDDCDAYTGPRKKAIQELQEKLLNQGRHKMTDLIIISHPITDYKRTRSAINEATHLIIFPRSTVYQALYYLCDKLGFQPAFKAINRMRDESRWVCMMKESPQCIVSEREARLLNMYTAAEEAEMAGEAPGTSERDMVLVHAVGHPGHADEEGDDRPAAGGAGGGRAHKRRHGDA